MYGWIWRQLPGPWPARLATATLLIAAAVALLMFVVFPWVESLLPFDNVAV